MSKTNSGMRYVRGLTLPRTVGRGVLCHNHVRHTADMPCGINGFRAWREDRPPRGFKKCHCGWAGLPHYSRNPTYKCEPGEWVNLMMLAPSHAA